MPDQWTNYGFLSDVAVPASRALGVLGDDRPPKAHAAPKGWGFGFFQGPSAYVIRKATAPLTVERLAKMSASISSRAYVAHVRVPTVGEIKDSNTQPFRHGVWLFTHQGTIERFRRIKPIMNRHLESRFREEIAGTTDSEYCFYLFLSNLKGSGYLKRGDIPLEIAVTALQETGHALSRWSDEVEAEKPWGGNFIITNGQYLLATRRCAPVYYRTLESVPMVQPLAEQNADSPSVGEQPTGSAVVVASHPLDAEHWTELSENRILAVTEDLSITTEPFIKQC